MKTQLTISGLNTFTRNGLLLFALFLIGLVQNAAAQENTIVAEVTAPLTGTTHIVNTPITLTVDASSDAGVDRVNFKIDGQQIKSDGSEPWTHSWTPEEPGTYEITATIVDFDVKRLTTEPVTITVVEATSLEQLPFTEDNTPHSIPGRIEFEHYDIGGLNVAYWDKVNQNSSEFRPDEMVDISTDGTKVRDIKTGEWLEYTINVEETADYELYIRHESRRDVNLPQVTVSFFDEEITFIEDKILTFTGSGNWLTENIGTVNMAAGEHVLRFHFLQFGFDVDYFVLRKVGATYDVTFNDGETTTTVTSKADGTVDLPEVPTRAEEEFKYWVTASGAKFDEMSIVPADMEVTAVWGTKTFTLSVTAENGTVAVGPEEQEKYDINTELSLTATAAEGYEFTAWSGDYEGSDNPLTVTVTKDLSITAIFTSLTPTFEVTFNDGTTTTVKTSKPDGTVDLPEAPTHIEKIFQHWETASGAIFDETTVVTENMEVNAVWEMKTFNVNITSENGSVVVGPSADVYEINTEITLTATPAEGYTFESWSGDYTGTDNPATVTVTSDMNITANYKMNAVTSIDPIQVVSKVYPNPSNGSITIELPTAENAAYKVYTTVGGLVAEGTFQKATKIDLSGNTPGVYVLEVSTKKGVETKKLLIK
ncbi:InlB B-repeat-containing protein [Flammeovirga sp. OC4]|uniref:InlB B-repeat-containing protein n=1 Tax=Flammeovirga sp. OC4 TaxID=1382345 RepID=UPI0005C7436E|nr:InlB B-repeat-containing protein [Flammeovirga sp. OC4]